MIGVLKLCNPIKAYPWGSRTAIADLLGRPEADQPQAELWMGAHPTAPSKVEIDGQWQPLDAVIERDPEAILGPEVNAAFAGRLPFLFKVLAAERPLSIQAHPNLSQAAAGFRRENVAGVGLADRTRNYRDANHKPEILFALSPFVALRGFRDGEEADRRLEAVGLAGQLPRISRDGPREFLAAFLGLEGGALAGARARVLEGSHQLDEASAHWIERFEIYYPGDRGVLAPVFMNLIELEPGQAVFTGPGVLHAYLDGVGIELMASSDNVLRCGLTHKHVDAEELLRIVTFEQGPGLVLPTSRAGVDRFATPADEFQLSLIRATGPEARQLPSPGPCGAVRILLCTEGRGVILGGPAAQPYQRGDSFLIPAIAGEIAVQGEGTFFLAEVARCPAPVTATRVVAAG